VGVAGKLAVKATSGERDQAWKVGSLWFLIWGMVGERDAYITEK